MDVEDRPYSGSTQPGLGLDCCLSSDSMGKARESKSKKPVAMIRAILGRNVEELRDRIYKDLPNVTARNRALAHKIGSTLAQVQRICSGELGTSIDTVEWLADALRVRPQDLLTPYFATARDAPSSEPVVAGEAQLQQSGNDSRPMSAQ